MAKRARRPESGLNKAAARIGRVLGKALNRIHRIDSEVGKVMDARGRNLQQLGRDAGRKIGSLGKSGSPAGSKRRKAARSAARATKRAAGPSGSGRRVAARRKAKQ